MDPNNPPHPGGSTLVLIVAGILCGLIPLAVGWKRERIGIGWAGFWLCAVSGLLLGLLAALPMAGLMSIVIVAAGPPRKGKPPGATRRPRTPAPEPQDL